MSHVDDGRLHAYLDGALAGGVEERRDVEAHLRACADCRARLEAAREDRDQAGEILALLAPDQISTPPFEELRRRLGAGSGGSRAGGGSPRGPSRRLLGLGWAASILVALGGGWMARAAFTDVQDLPALRGDGVAADRPAASEPPIPASVEAAREEEPPVDVAPPRPAAGRAADPDPAADPDRAADRGPPSADPDRATDPTPPPAAEPVQERPDPAARDRAAADAVVLEQAAVVDALSDAWAAREILEIEARATREESWEAISPAAAAELLGRPPFGIADLPWESMEAVESDGAVLIRTFHPLPGGERLEVLQGAWLGTGLVPMTVTATTGLGRALGLRAEAARARTRDLALVESTPARPDKAEAPPRVSARQDGVVVVLRGLDDHAELQRLLARLR